MTSEADPRGQLQGKLVAVTGRLATLSREEARELVERAGARLAERPSRATALLVVGQGGPPLEPDGRPTRSLQRARALQREGAPLEIVTEEAFLERLVPERREDLARLYTPVQIARILGVTPARIRAWVRHDLIRPAKVVRRLPYFDFRQVATAKALSQLAKDGVTPARIRRSLEQVRAWLAEPDQALAQLAAIESGHELLFRTEAGQLAEASGQLRLDFEGEAPAGTGETCRSAEEWFERGILAEDLGRLEEAVRSYEHSLALGARDPEVLFNLGNALYSLERKTEAAQRFVEATRADPEFIEAWNNLGNALGDIDLPSEAVQAYRRALAIEPDYADAHFNLAETLAAMGARDAAERHWRAYLSQDPFSSWAEVVRARLAGG